VTAKIEPRKEATMLRNLSLFAGCIGITFLVGYSGPAEYFTKSSYFDGAVVIEYRQNYVRGINDRLIFRFYEKGSYEISFSITPGNGGYDQDKIPQNFRKTIKVVPREIIVVQHFLPDFLRVTIIKDGKFELHDFS